MLRIFEKSEILKAVDKKGIITAIEDGFRLLEQGEVVLGPVAHMPLPKSAIFHGKYGYVKDDEYFVLKAGCYVPENKKRGDSTIKSSMQIFDIETGEIIALLLDQGVLTNLRTAAAGAVSAKYFAPREVETIGIIGTGTQARLQLEYALEVISAKEVNIWGRNQDNTEDYIEEMSGKFPELVFNQGTTEQVCNNSELIITTTPSAEPILKTEWINPGTAVIAVGADAAGKQELEVGIVAQADMIVSDLKSQCLDHGEISHAYNSGLIEAEKVKNLGAVISDLKFNRDKEDIVIVDLTGVAIQDIQITKFIYEKLTENE
jgi:ornithine cyclodeaminase